MDNFYVVTGGPGMGKTSVINELRKRGYCCVPEAGRTIIQQQLLVGGNALPWLDRERFAMLMFEQSLCDFRDAKQNKAPLWFDRGIIDVAGYLELCGLPVPEIIERDIQRYRYNANVFITPPWKAIYQNDAERKQSFEEAVATYKVMRDMYSLHGYQLIELPETGITARAEFILGHL